MAMADRRQGPWTGPYKTQPSRGFHLRDGLTFQSLPGGYVWFFLSERDANGWWERPLTERPVPENEWASVVASMCSRGENGVTWEEARQFHGHIPRGVESHTRCPHGKLLFEEQCQVCEREVPGSSLPQPESPAPPEERKCRECGHKWDYHLSGRDTGCAVGGCLCDGFEEPLSGSVPPAPPRPLSVAPEEKPD